MTFSIIVPVYNVSRYIDECIKSIISQKDADYEIILVDDGSTDKSGDICDKYAKKYANIKVIHKKNGGASEARNTGIKEAEGEYIWFVDGDDYIGKNCLSNIEKTINTNSKPDIVCLELVKFFDNNPTKIKMNDGIDEKINQLKGDRLYNYVAHLPKYPASPCTKVIKHQFIAENKLFFINSLLAEDLEWSIRLFLAVRTVAYCPTESYFYRQGRAGSMSGLISEKKSFDILYTYRKWTTYAKRMENQSKKMVVASYMEYVFRFLLLGYESIPKAQRKKFRLEVKKGTWILGTRKDAVSRVIKTVYSFLGIRGTGLLLKYYLMLRKY